MKSKPTVLLVEDSPEDALLFRRALRNCRSEVQLKQVTDGRAAVDYLKGEGAFTDRKVESVRSRASCSSTVAAGLPATST